MPNENLLGLVFLGYVFWNEIGRPLVTRWRLNGKSLDGSGSIEERLRKIETFLSQQIAKRDAQWEELQRTLNRLGSDILVVRSRSQETDNQISILSAKQEVVRTRLEALERWRYVAGEPFRPTGAAE